MCWIKLLIQAVECPKKSSLNRIPPLTKTVWVINCHLHVFKSSFSCLRVVLSTSHRPSPTSNATQESRTLAVRDSKVKTTSRASCARAAALRYRAAALRYEGTTHICIINWPCNVNDLYNALRHVVTEAEGLLPTKMGGYVSRGTNPVREEG